MNVREDRGDGAGPFSGRLGAPGARIEFGEQNLIDPVVEGEGVRQRLARQRPVKVRRSHFPKPNIGASAPINHEQ